MKNILTLFGIVALFLLSLSLIASAQNAIEVTASGANTCILKSNGNVQCWGYNQYGQANNYTKGDAIAVTAGDRHTCVLKSNGNVHCWGANNYGQSNDYPEWEYGAANDYPGWGATAVIASYDYTCILKTNGNMHCWGIDDYGQTNDWPPATTTTTSTSPSTTISSTPTTTTSTTTIPGTAYVLAGSAYARTNDIISIMVNATALGNVLSYSFRLSYDPAKLAVVRLKAGDYLAGCTTPATFLINLNGSVGIDAACLGQTVSSGNGLANITFMALSPGNVTLKPVNVSIALGSGLNVTNVFIVTGDGIIRVTNKLGDATGDGQVNYGDLLILASSYGRTADQSGFDSRADYNGDGKVDYADLLVLAAYYGT